MFEAPSPAVTLPLPDSNYVQPNFGHGLRIWWAFYWPTTLIGGFLLIVLNFWLRKLYEDMVLSANFVGPILKFDPYVLSYVVAFFVMYYILRKNFRRFRLGLLSNRGGEGAQLLSPTFGRTLRVWWTYSWRTLLYTAVVWIAAVLPLSSFARVFSSARLFTAIFDGLLALSVSAAVGLYAFYSNILDEDISGFRVCLLPRQVETISHPTPAATPVNT
jgi:hypothetical protein